MSLTTDAWIGGELLLDSSQYASYWIGGTLTVDAGITATVANVDIFQNAATMTGMVSRSVATAQVENRQNAELSIANAVHQASTVLSEYDQEAEPAHAFLGVLKDATASDVEFLQQLSPVNALVRHSASAGNVEQDQEVSIAAVSVGRQATVINTMSLQEVQEAVASASHHAGTVLSEYAQEVGTATIILPIGVSDVFIPQEVSTAGATTSKQATVSDAQVLQEAWPATWVLTARGLDMQFVDDENYRKIIWNSGEEEIYVAIDGSFYSIEHDGSFQLAANHLIRQYLQAVIGNNSLDWESYLPTPLDEVQLEWTSDILNDNYGYYKVRRKPSGGDFSVIETLRGNDYKDGPLPNGNYEYDIVAVNRYGQEQDSTDKAATIDSAPEPASNFSLSLDSKTITLSWTPSPSNIDHYNIYKSNSDGLIDLSTVYDTTASTTWNDDVSGDTGHIGYLVRAVEANGIEEASLINSASIEVENGAEVGFPAEPERITVDAIESAKVRVDFMYDPAKEQNPPGNGQEARIYCDNATGTMDWSTPLGTVALDGPVRRTFYSWQSDALIDGETYKFGVRVASDTQETDNTDTYDVTVRDSAPTTPELTVTVV
jgi:hypothetical protein